MIIIPLLAGALAVIVTLCYASWLDILDRRVPFVTWLPMLVIGLAAAGIALLSLNDGTSLFTGYLQMVSVILYIAYLGNRDDKKPLQAAFVITVFLIQIYSLWYFAGINGTSGVLLSVASLLITAYATWLESRNIDSLFSNAWPLLYFLVGTVCWFSYSLSGGGILFLYLGMIEMFCFIFYLFGILQLFGGADAWALIFITLIIPLFPFEPLAGYPAVPFFPFTVLVNAVIFNLVAPVGLFIMNLISGNRAPWPYLFLGYPVDGNTIGTSFGFIMEEFGEREGVLTRRFLTVRETLGSMVRGHRRIYTKDLRTTPEKFSKELGWYKKAGKVWISYGVPFIVPITAGLLFGLFVGDILTICLKLAGGI
ncbi:MAG TPA: A24 family peptidase C-terminal domain-containing protein [Methanoregulaceae archaeon]|nr:A24 family peptidase C-terminal domain-containing protein [Methanoregulaceae archaeon]